jgi:hypothetical protein
MSTWPSSCWSRTPTSTWGHASTHLLWAPQAHARVLHVSAVSAPHARQSCGLTACASPTPRQCCVCTSRTTVLWSHRMRASPTPRQCCVCTSRTTVLWSHRMRASPTSVLHPDRPIRSQAQAYGCFWERPVSLAHSCAPAVAWCLLVIVWSLFCLVSACCCEELLVAAWRSSVAVCSVSLGRPMLSLYQVDPSMFEEAEEEGAAGAGAGAGGP